MLFVDLILIVWLAILLFYLIFVDVLTAGFWKQRETLESDKLKYLVDSLPTFVLHSKATSTNVKYKNSWLCWKKWERENLGCNRFPVSPFHLCLYLRDKFEACSSPAPLESAVYGIRWAHLLAGLPSPTDHSMVKQVLEAGKRLLGKPVVGKLPLDIDIISKVVEKYHTPLAPLSHLRICFIFVIAFAGLMRCDEIIQIQRKHVNLFHDHMTIFCPRRKNDQRGHGHTIHIARSGKITCPVSLTAKLLSRLSSDSDQHLVCRLSSSGTAFQNAISYSRVREIFRETIAQFVPDSRRFGTHSLKKGGATASCAAGISGESLDMHAGWRSAKSKYSYIDFSIKDKLAVSRAINL